MKIIDTPELANDSKASETCAKVIGLRNDIAALCSGLPRYGLDIPML